MAHPFSHRDSGQRQASLMQNDTSLSFYELVRRGGGLLSERVPRIQAFGEQREKKAMFRCVQASSRGLKQYRLNNDIPIELSHFHSDKYIAVSCPWLVPGHEAVSGRYRFTPEVQNEIGFRMPQDAVLRRILNFKACNPEFQNTAFWIDKLCINQNGSEEKETAVHSMDLVYRLSRVTLGLLFLPITSLDHLKILRDLLLGKFAKGSEDSTNLTLLVPVEETGPVLEVIESILLDDWWHRAWIFQEEFLTFRALKLLIPCSLERTGLFAAGKKGLFGQTAGEIEMSAFDFRTEVTTFCLALSRYSDLVDQDRLTNILRIAGRYALLYRAEGLAGPRSVVHAMAPAIFEDVGSRGVTFPSDILAIAANCCGYVARLNANALNEVNESLSIAILTLFLMNGEILRHDSPSEEVLGKTIFDCLRSEKLPIDPPMRTRELVFIKHCRLILMKMTPNGVVARGDLWELADKFKVDVSDDEVRYYWEEDDPENFNTLTDAEIGLLQVLSRELMDNHNSLSQQVNQFLRRIGTGKKLPHWCPDHIHLIMAKSLCLAMANRQNLWLARPIHGHRFHGVFVRGQHDDLAPTFAFTSLGVAEHMDLGYKLGSRLGRRTTKFASLEVDFTSEDKQIVPKKWINGICFAGSDEKQQEWTIPWPKWMHGSSL